MKDPNRERWWNSRWFIGLLAFGVPILWILIVMNSERMDSSKGKGNTRFEGRMEYEVIESVTAGVTLEWGEVVSNGYELHWGIAPNYTNSLDTPATMVTVAGLDLGVTYNFKVRAYNRPCWSGTPPNCANFVSPFSAAMSYTVPAGATPPPTPLPTVPPTPLPTAPPTATVPQVTPSPAPTAPPTPTAAPTATAVPGPGITVNPTAINFTGIVGGPFPAWQTITITTSNNANWTSFDTIPWCDAGPTTGVSGTATTLKCHTDGRAAGSYTDKITFSAPGLTSKVVVVKLKMTAAPTATPIRTPTPSPGPTAIPTPCQPCPTCPP